MKRLDLNCFCGRWPFYKVDCNSVTDLQKQHRRYGIQGGLVSSLEAIFYQDPLEAELALAQQLEGTPYKQAMVLNPTLPGWESDLSRCVKDLSIAAVRLVPGLHGYRLTNAQLLDPVWEKLAQYGLPLLITVRLEDERCTYMIKPQPVTAEDIAQFADSHPQLPILLTGLKNHEAAQLQDAFARHKKLYADISCFCDGNTLSLAGGAMKERLVFGTGAPLLEMAAATALLTYCGIENGAQEKIYSGQGFMKNEDIL